MTDPSGYPDYEERTGIPRWVKVSALIVIVIGIAVVLVMVIGGGGGEGGHGPSRHGLGGEPAEQISAQDSRGDDGQLEGGLE